MKLTKRIKLRRNHPRSPWVPVGYYKNRPNLPLLSGEIGRIETFCVIAMTCKP